MEIVRVPLQTSTKSVSKSALHQTIMKSPTKSCQLDPIPTKLVQESGILSETITNIVNCSLLSGEFPTELKLSLLRPSVKKPAMDPELFPSYRLIANLSFLSKMIGRTAASQMRVCLQKVYLQECTFFP